MNQFGPKNNHIPNTMMIHLQYASPTNRTKVAARRFHLATLLTKPKTPSSPVQLNFFSHPWIPKEKNNSTASLFFSFFFFLVKSFLVTAILMSLNRPKHLSLESLAHISLEVTTQSPLQALRSLSYPLGSGGFGQKEPTTKVVCTCSMR